MVKRIYVIINPASGQPKPVLHTLNSVFRAAGVDWDVFITKESSNAHHFAREALAAGADVVAAFGGDGTVMEVASALMGSQVPVAILPGGTANVMSVELGIPKDLEAAAQIACNPSSQIQAVDVGQMGERIFMLRVGLGFAADHVIGATREMKDRYGELAYTISALETLKKLPLARYRLTLDGEQVEVEGVTCRVDNSGNMGIPGLVASRAISVCDGLLDVTVIRNADGASLYSIVASASGHGTPNPEAFFHRQAREIILEADPPQRVVGDGEEWGETPISVRVLPQAVRFLVCP
ncbi:MAG: diacylglycerol kinase family lipid kinase [Anaerolineae bacterium]